jgi:hypothetical protein
MTHDEMKKKVLALIEELNPNNPNLTEDPDISAKYNYVANQVMMELVRLKKLAKYVEMPVIKGQLVTFEDIGNAVGYEVYQLSNVGGVNFEVKANGTVLKILEDGTAEIDCFIFPEQITEKTKGNFELELPSDILEIMPYGIAADLLKSDVSTEYGSIYATRYETMLQRLDPRNFMPSISIEGGVRI